VFNSPLLPWADRTLDGRTGCLIRPGLPHPSVRSSRPRRETNGHLRMDLVVPQPPPVTGGQHTPLGEDAAQFHRPGPQAVPPRGAAADESAGTCGAGSPLPSGRVQRSNTEHPSTIAAGISGPQLLPRRGSRDEAAKSDVKSRDDGCIYAVLVPRCRRRL